MTKTTQSRRLPKFHRAPKLAGPIQLTDRDRELLYTLFHYRFLPTSLLAARHFGSATRARNRLKLLFHHSYLDRTFLPTVGPALGEAIYSLGPAAVPELATVYGLDPAAIKRKRQRVEPFFLAHELLVARFRLRLAQFGAPHGVGMKDWREGAAATLTVEGRDRSGEFRSERITPDGMAWLASPRARFAFCLEADRGTMTVGRVRTKFVRYGIAQESGAMRRHFGAERFRVLVVAPSEKRLASLKQAAEGGGAPNVWLTTEDQLERDLVAEAVWQRPGKTERFPLFRPEQLGSNRPKKGGSNGKRQ